MDKRFVGKWYGVEEGSTLNIFDETPLRMKMSFSSSGHYNFEPNCVYERDGFLCFEINDEKYRMVYRVKPRDGSLKGYYSQFGKETPVRYERISDVPEDEPYRYLPAEIYVPESGEPRIDLLRKYAAYDRSHPELPYATEYCLGGEAPDILRNYDISSYVNETNCGTDAVVFGLLDFVCDHFGHDGSSGMPSGRKIEDIISFCEKHGGRINCRGLAILLASLLRLYGIKARHITCMPYEDPFDDCHVVVDCVMPSGKRIMLDPSYRLYLKDENGGYVSLEKLRSMLIAGEPVCANGEASYNGGGFDKEFYRNYMTKNTLRFSRGTRYADGSDDSASRRIELVPADYLTENFSDACKAEFVFNDAEFWKL